MRPNAVQNARDLWTDGDAFDKAVAGFGIVAFVADAGFNVIPGWGEGKALLKQGTKLGIAEGLKFGKNAIKPFSKASLETVGKKGATQAHHLIEKRFAKLFEKNASELDAIVLTKKEHQVFTNAWRKAIGHTTDKVAKTTANATRRDVENAARDIYKNYPEILRKLGLD